MNMTRAFGGLRMHRVVTPPAEQAKVQETAKASEVKAEERVNERAEERKAA